MSKSKIPRLSKKTAELIDRAVDRAEVLLLDNTPEEAFAKAAHEYNLTDDQTHILIRGWNISKFLTKFSSASDLVKRLEPLEVIDFDRVLEIKHKLENTKTASPVWGGYYIDPDFIDVKKPSLEDYFVKDATTDPSRFNRLVKIADATIEKRIKLLRSSIELAKRAYIELIGKIHKKLTEVKQAFAHTRTNPEIAKKHLRVSNPKAYAVLCALDGSLDKLAHYNDDNILYDPKKYPYCPLIELSELLEKGEKAKSVIKKAEAAYKKHLDRLGIKPEEELELLSYLSPTPHYPSGRYPVIDPYAKPDKPVISDSELNIFTKTGTFLPTEISENIVKTATVKTDIVKTDIVKTAQDLDNLSGMDPSDVKELLKQQEAARRELSAALNDAFRAAASSRPSLTTDTLPELHASLVKGLSSKTTGKHVDAVTAATKNLGFVAELIASDNILSNYDPHKVFSAYNQLFNVAPTVMRNKIIAKELLKKYMEQGESLDTYDMKTLVEMEARTKRSRGSSEW